MLRALARSSSIAAAISGLSSPLYQTRSSSPGAIGCGERRDRRRANQSGGCWRAGAGRGGERRPPAGRAPEPGGSGLGAAGRDPLLEGGPHSARLCPRSRRSWIRLGARFKLKAALCCPGFLVKASRLPRRRKKNNPEPFCAQHVADEKFKAQLGSAETRYQAGLRPGSPARGRPRPGSA